MTTLNVGIATYAQIKARMLRIARGELEASPNDPKIWFTSVESLAHVLSSANRELLQIIVSQHPRSLQELATISGRKKSNLSRTLKTMAGFGLIELQRGERGRLAPRVLHDRLAFEVSLLSESPDA